MWRRREQIERRRGELVEEGPEGLGRVADAMTSAEFGALEAALDTLSPDGWADLIAVIGSQSAQGVRRSRQRSAEEPKHGYVVLLPGIMGSDLAVIDAAGVPSLLWFSVSAMVRGGLRRLALPADERSPPHRIQPGGLMKLFYLPMQVRLAVHWHTQLFPYDWRLDIRELADQLAAAIRRLPDEPVHIVAHSMGGLVSRAMIQHHPEVWKRMQKRNDDSASGGRLLMLGTPNRGSFAPVQAFTGQDRKIRGLALLAAGLSTEDVVKVVATFPGLYEMLPFRHAGLSSAAESLYKVEGWPDPCVHQVLLDRAAEFHDEIDKAVDPSRMVYVAGFGHKTVDDIERRNGRLRWHRTHSGDGTVPHSLGLLPNVRTFWSTSSHGSLPKDEALLGAVDELLLHGETSRLPSGDQPPSFRGDEGEWIEDEVLAAEVERQAAAARSHGEALDLLADVVPVAATEVRPVTVHVDVVWGDVSTVDAEVVAVGHYQNVYPTAAEAALDKAISAGIEDEEERVLHAATRRGVLTGALGEVSLFPRPRPPDAPRLAAIVGMGRPGRFGLPQHEVALRNLVWTCERVVGAKTVAFVLFGSGSDNLDVEEAVESLLRALDVAVREHDLVGTLGTIQIVDWELGRAERIHSALRRCVSGRGSDALALVDLGPRVETSGGQVSGETALELLLPAISSHALRFDLVPDELSDQAKKKVVEALAELEPENLARVEVRAVRAVDDRVPTRLSFLARGQQIWVSAISDSATVAERPLGLELDVFEALVAEAEAEAGGDVRRAGQMLLEVAVPGDFRQLLGDARCVVIEVDRHTAALPWEILGDGGPRPSGNSALGLRAPLARQLRAAHGAPPTLTGRLVLRRALVIGDPGETTGSGLPGASREARAVAAALERFGVQVDLLLGSGGDRPGVGAATLAKLLHRLIHRRYDLVHYAGHGTFSVENTAGESGWVLADRLFTGLHLACIPRLPPLMVANACHSGRVSTGLPGLADAFMSRGIRNLIGSARAVSDDGAERFCTAFYQKLLTGVGGSTTSQALGDAVFAARTQLGDGHPDWDAYQLYGDPDFRFWDTASASPAERDASP